MSVTVFTKNSCPQCLVTKRHLKDRGVEFETINVDEQTEWRDRLIEMGYMAMPVVLVEDEDVWSGYSSDSIEEWWPKQRKAA
ncbi:glutaredoxin domain-containing protein [Mycobacterium sp. AZCC_0083]|uniref:glutaredoxin domain-containing protein n=1 Tax=Mycobacterium sp. AZCC_0083 TaxID=2735882 RepID=UPI0016205DB8|nr:glutaredoxin domain-containing protein [Mycobacterium sp. AZCC_0083]MBB5167185.1 glutaredoxin-like protein NrdH [Mycobacterium sp. AZCC_0083]